MECGQYLGTSGQHVSFRTSREPAPFLSSSCRRRSKKLNVPSQSVGSAPNLHGPSALSSRRIRIAAHARPSHSAQPTWSSAAMQTFFGVEVVPGKLTPFVPPPIDAQLHLSQVRHDSIFTFYSPPKVVIAQDHKALVSSPTAF